MTHFNSQLDALPEPRFRRGLLAGVAAEGISAELAALGFPGCRMGSTSSSINSDGKPRRIIVDLFGEVSDNMKILERLDLIDSSKLAGLQRALGRTEGVDFRRRVQHRDRQKFIRVALSYASRATVWTF